MNKKYNVAIIGGITSGITSPIIPVLNMGTLKSGMLLDSAILAVVCFAIAFSLGKIYAKQHDYTIDANQELFALGSANAFASFFSCFPATASLSRTAVMGENAKSHISSLVSCLILILLLLFFAPALSDLPKSVIAVIIIVAQQSLVMQVKDFKSAWDISRWEGVSINKRRSFVHPLVPDDMDGNFCRRPPARYRLWSGDRYHFLNLYGRQTEHKLYNSTTWQGG